MATDPKVADATKLAAIKDALDRGGLTAKTTVEVEVGLKPYEDIMGDLAGVARISREESRARRGLPPAPSVPAAEPDDMEVVDAELVPEEDTAPPACCTGTTRDADRPATHTAARHRLRTRGRARRAPAS